MTDHKDACSYANIVNAHSLIRPDCLGVIPVDVIMAIKLMTPEALQEDYCFDTNGEDIGWSKSATAQGLKLAFDGRVCSKHVMRPGQLEKLDPRCGF